MEPESLNVIYVNLDLKRFLTPSLHGKLVTSCTKHRDVIDFLVKCVVKRKCDGSDTLTVKR